MNSPPANNSGVNTTDYLYDDYNGTFADTATACHNPNHPVDQFTYIVEGILLTVVSLIGCFGNIFSIVGLAMNKRMPLISSQVDNSGSSKQINGHLSFTRLLIALAVFDFLYLFIGIAIFGLPVLSQAYKENVYVIIVPVCVGLAHMSRVGSVLLTVSVSIERYYSVCHPMRQFRSKRLLLPVTIAFTVLYNIPKFCEYKIEINEDGNYILCLAELRMNQVYVMIYHHWSKFLLVEFIPYVLMIVLNCLIWRRVRAMVRMRHDVGLATGPVHDEEIDLAGILISVVSIFIACQSVKLVPDLYEMFTCTLRGLRQDRGTCPGDPTIEYFIDISHFALALNSAANFFIYILKGGRFRDVILQMFRSMTPGASRRCRNSETGTTGLRLRSGKLKGRRPSGGGGNYEMVLVATPLGGTTDEDVVCDNIGKNNKAMYDESSGASQVALVGTPRSRIAVGDGERTCDSTAFTSYPGPCSTICDKDLGGCLQAGGGDMELRWPFLMYDIPTIVVPDIEESVSCGNYPNTF